MVFKKEQTAKQNMWKNDLKSQTHWVCPLPPDISDRGQTAHDSESVSKPVTWESKSPPQKIPVRIRF